MSTNGEKLLVVCLEEGAQDACKEGVLSGLGVSAGDPRWRQHRPNLLTVRSVKASDDTVRRISEMPGVHRVVPLSRTQDIVNCWSPEAKKVVLRNGAVFGGPQPTVIAGPCSVESRDQVLETACSVAEAGAKVLRGGAFKPRSSPFDFGGLGEKGLEYMALAAERAGLPFVTEVLDVEHLNLVAQYADMIQIGSRNMHNGPLLMDIASHPSGLPILLKRGLAATVDELIHAAEYVLLGRLSTGQKSAGLILCERGIRTFVRDTRFTLDIAAVPILQRLSGLPVIVNPSHAAGSEELVAPLARAALAVNADGLIVEVHRDPVQAWCDGPQSLTPAAFAALMAEIPVAANGRKPWSGDWSTSEDRMEQSCCTGVECSNG